MSLRPEVLVPPAPAAAPPDRDELAACILANLRFVLARQRPGAAFIDTKLDLATGEDFPAGDPLRGQGVIYNWIQSRGLEALASHGLWLRREPAPGGDALLARVEALLPRVAASLETARSLHGGRLPFRMTPGGRLLPGDPAPGPGHSLSDLFHAKGLLAAAGFLGDDRLAATAGALLDGIVRDLRSGAFRFGQIALDPKNPVREVPGRFSHAGRMIAISAATLLCRRSGLPAHRELGLGFIRHLLDRHACPLTGDFWEFIDTGARPWRDPGGALWSDPGHAIEFAGLGLAHLRACGDPDPALAARLRRLLVRNFENGFTGLGIVKAYDLAARRPLNTDMPWWSLPETMRATALGALTAGDGERDRLTSIFTRCWRAFRAHYVRPERGFMAVQCLDARGRVASAIPATPDADPCYHTGLSLLDCLPFLEQTR